MHTYKHKVHYYETDMMGITHHSNYVRWMEEARSDYLKEKGYGLKVLESMGITSPVVSLECQYKQVTTFDDVIVINIYVDNYTGARLSLVYTMINEETGEVVLTAKSSHCFIDKDHRPLAIRKVLPDFDKVLKTELSTQECE